jgi:hypothetical protein
MHCTKTVATGPRPTLALCLCDPRGKYLFSPLQEALKHLDTHGRVVLRKSVQDTLTDFCWMVADLASRLQASSSTTLPALEWAEFDTPSTPRLSFGK